MLELLNELKALRDSWIDKISENGGMDQGRMGEEDAYTNCVEDIDELIALYE